jgi:D-alanine-D-alanine ligase
LNLKDLFKHLALIVAFFLLVLFIIMTWLRLYTNHGQQLELPDYTGQLYEAALKDADKRSFRMVVNDSIHQVGKPGGLIITQNPISGSKVKENRKIYVTTTKYSADLISVASLPTLYGTEYNSKCKDLKYLEIECKVRSYKYDAGEKDHILEVYYNNELIVSKVGRKNDVMIEKGASLEFVLSNKQGAIVKTPDLKCMNLGAARFNIEARKLQVGNIQAVGEITNQDAAYIVGQSPNAKYGESIESGSTIDLVIQQEKPADCP